MTKDRARQWLEKRGYQVVLQMSNCPSPSYYIAIPKGNRGRIRKGTLNGIVKQLK